MPPKTCLPNVIFNGNDSKRFRLFCISDMVTGLAGEMIPTFWLGSRRCPLTMDRVAMVTKYNFKLVGATINIMKILNNEKFSE